MRQTSFEVADPEHVEMLKKSVAAVGHIRPILVNADNPKDVLGGKHRIIADENWPQQPRKVESELDREIIILHDNVHRTIPEEHTKHRLLRIARLLSTTGGKVNGKMVEPVKPEDVCERLTNPDHPLVPFHPRTVRKLLPGEYKHKEHAVRVKTGFEAPGPQIPREDLNEKQREILNALGDTKPPVGGSHEPEPLTTKEPLSLEVALPTPKCICPTCEDFHTCYG